MGEAFQGGAWIDWVARLLIVAYFLMHLLHDVMPEAAKYHVGRLRSFGVPFPALSLWVGLTAEAIGCLLLLTGWHADIGIYCLIVFTIIANAIYNRFWTVRDPVVHEFSRMLLGANTAVLGGLLLLLKSSA